MSLHSPTSLHSPFRSPRSPLSANSVQSSSLRRRWNPRHFDPSEEKRPVPPHRHSGPSAPWPWINIEDEVDAVQLGSPLPPIPPLCDHETCGGCWRGYPQSRFPNWTPSQVKRSQIQNTIENYNRDIPAKIYHVDVDQRGHFTDSDRFGITEEGKDVFWEKLIRNDRPPNIRVRALFLENMTGPVLQMLGAKYNIEPFFFSSSLSWIPSRFQEEVRPGLGDHITLTLTFVRAIDSTTAPSTHSGSSSARQVINTQGPLYLKSEERFLILDLLAVHLIRSTEGNTMISYHHQDDKGTSASYLHERIRFAGQSVYWQSIFQKSQDPTFVLLTFIWHTLYAWDEALELLYKHICSLEVEVIDTRNLRLTHELHMIRAHHLHYSSLLEDLEKAVQFILDTPNPAMDSQPESDKAFSRQLLEKECKTLILDIKRLEASRRMQDKRLKNVMNLMFATVNITDSRRMQELTEAAVRDSAAMKQIAYLSMIFLPASFVAGVFGMNVGEIVPGTHGSLPHYVATALPLTILTIWVVMAFQSKHLFGTRTVSMWQRVAWPFFLFRTWRTRDKNYDQEHFEKEMELPDIPLTLNGRAFTTQNLHWQTENR
ncbi:hypothetical protein C8J56DRAFT_933090 [Mycena floridula]|nr:hypothetical protein C8J56DRAFT_933090 [Mycena floridula]